MSSLSVASSSVEDANFDTVTDVIDQVCATVPLSPGDLDDQTGFLNKDMTFSGFNGVRGFVNFEGGDFSDSCHSLIINVEDVACSLDGTLSGFIGNFDKDTHVTANLYEFFLGKGFLFNGLEFKETKTTESKKMG